MNTEKTARLKNFLGNHPALVSAVVPFNKESDKLCRLDFTASNSDLNPDLLGDTDAFSEWVCNKLRKENCLYGIGGYNEHRTIYSRSSLFDKNEEPRRLHLGVDIWGSAGTNVFAPLDGKVHSFKFNDNFGDYGATIILEHAIDDLIVHTLYGHLNLASIQSLTEGLPIIQGQKIAEFGDTAENGHWPPHLHFQLIFDIGNMAGDYPGVCRYSEKEFYLSNCPDPDLILKHTFKY